MGPFQGLMPQQGSPHHIYFPSHKAGSPAPELPPDQAQLPLGSMAQWGALTGFDPGRHAHRDHSTASPKQLAPGSLTVVPTPFPAPGASAPPSMEPLLPRAAPSLLGTELMGPPRTTGVPALQLQKILRFYHLFPDGFFVYLWAFEQDQVTGNSFRVNFLKL